MEPNPSFPGPHSDSSSSPASSTPTILSSAQAPEDPARLGVFYRLDYSRGAFQEFFWGNPLPQYPIIALSALVIKLGRIRVPGSSDHPPVEELHPFETPLEAVPAEVRERFQPLLEELAGLGFMDPVYHVILDGVNATRIFRATLRHSSGRAWARIHHRIWDHVRPPKVYLFPQFVTGFTDGSWLLSCAGKKDTLEAPVFRVNRFTGLGATALWESHQKQLNQETARSIQLAETPAAVMAQSESSHAALRDFHLRRGFFQPLTADEQQTGARLAAASTSGDGDAAIHEELNRLLSSCPGWGNAMVILVVSLFAFLAAGAGRERDWKFLLLLIPILFVHELGHYLAMKGFHYRNLRMFFIPLFGAAVTGQNYNIAGWKKALVYLAGPVPSIVLAVVLGSVGIVSRTPWLIEAAFVALLINGFNLLPILPLDGGWVMQVAVFTRHHLLDTTFRVVAALALIGIGISLDAVVLSVLGGLALFALPVSYKLARITGELRQRTLELPSPDEPGIPKETADVIIQEVKRLFPKGATNKSLAQHALQVFESLNTRPPGWAATLGLIGVHGGSLVLAVIFAGVLALANSKGGLLGALSRRGTEPQRSVACDSVLTWRGTDFVLSRSNSVLVADFEKGPEAEAAFRTLTNQLPALAAVRCLGSTLFVSLSVADAAERDRQFDALEQLTTNLHVLNPGVGLRAGLTATAPDEATARNLESELEAYFNAPYPNRLLPPWLMGDRMTDRDRAAFQKARATWSRLESAGEELDTNSVLERIAQRQSEAERRGNRAEYRRLTQEYRAEWNRLERAAIEAMQDTPESPLDTNLVAAYLRLPQNRYTNQDYREAVIALSPLMGALPQQGGEVSAEDMALTVRFGSVSRTKAQIHLHYLTFTAAAEGLPAVVDWLCSRGFRDVKYELHWFSGMGGDGLPGDLE